MNQFAKTLKADAVTTSESNMQEEVAGKFLHQKKTSFYAQEVKSETKWFAPVYNLYLLTWLMAS